MSLLLLTEPPFLEPEEKVTRTFTTGDLFEVYNGVIEERHLPIVAETNTELNFIRINSFTENGVLHNKIRLRELQDIQTNKREVPFKKHGDKKTINKKKILRDADYIIYTRGVPRGFSMLKSEIDDDLNVVATHQFICLRPRTNLIDFFLPYLHLVMDLFVDRDLKKIFDSKLKLNGEKYGVFNSIGIKEIKDIEITMLKLVDSQRKAYERYDQRKQESEMATYHLKMIKDLIHGNYY
jgi:hypothetical protein